MKKFFEKITFEHTLFLTSAAVVLFSLALKQFFDPAAAAWSAAYLILSVRLYKAIASEILGHHRKIRVAFFVVVKLTTAVFFVTVLCRMSDRALMGVFASIIGLTISLPIYALLTRED